jgi:hypothetical protein
MSLNPAFAEASAGEAGLKRIKGLPRLGSYSHLNTFTGFVLDALAT